MLTDQPLHLGEALLTVEELAVHIDEAFADITRGAGDAADCGHCGVRGGHGAVEATELFADMMELDAPLLDLNARRQQLRRTDRDPAARSDSAEVCQGHHE